MRHKDLIQIIHKNPSSYLQLKIILRKDCAMIVLERINIKNKFEFIY